MNAGQGNIPEKVIDVVLQQHDIVDTVSRYVHLTKQGKYMKGLCPFHSEKTPSFTVTPDRQIFYCYGCGKGGNAIKFRMEIEGLSFPEAVKIMAEESHIVLPEGQGAVVNPPNPERDRLLQAYEWTAKFYHFLLKNTEHGKAAMDYLRSRGFNDKVIDQFQIGFAPDRWDTLVQFLTKRSFDLHEMEKGGLLTKRHDSEEDYLDRFRGRVMFPISDRNGRIIAFAGRILGEGQPKYLNSPESKLFNKSRILYNLHQAKPSIRKLRQIVLFEGYGDVISAWEAGVQNGVATMGTSLTESHAALMKTMADEIVICYDGDRAGQAAAMKTIPLLESISLNVRISVLNDGLDPDEFIQKYGADRFNRQIIDGAVSTTKFKLIYLKKNHILLEEDGKIAYTKEVLPIIAALASSTEREVYLRELASELQLSFESLKQDCNEIRQSMQKNMTDGDNNDKRWNNGRQKGQVSAPTLLPAYHTGERRLLAMMLQDAEAASYVEKRLGDAFNIDDHAAIAAYLYAYYAQGKPPDISRFMSSLHDDRLEKTVSSISMMDTPPEWNVQELDDCIREVQKVPQKRQIDKKKEEMINAERSGDFLRAAQIASEIIALERQ
ncbi:DNA primase [Paenibacillus sp. KQZ6P-2]|uniref:DNA primase n=1 Tax=Paenibacillus mangrovi TaxID=2931978 RepID=A0A9X1WLA0_9BACL|nr:DNA primase [Paenibacillus mangrovi]MCJ8011407.1 DNA primase [Paenibacillus mangrovi]